MSYSAPDESGEAVRSGGQTASSVEKVGRNQPCPCGSGKKYKLCHGRPGRLPEARLWGGARLWPGAAPSDSRPASSPVREQHVEVGATPEALRGVQPDHAGEPSRRLRKADARLHRPQRGHLGAEPGDPGVAEAPPST
ncbi:hypothetical protein G7085_00705 [Tessaracoccus sp. HDW20]|nr:hypothetical protein [Tessaracoccus coleopterorum]